MGKKRRPFSSSAKRVERTADALNAGTCFGVSLSFDEMAQAFERNEIPPLSSNVPEMPISERSTRPLLQTPPATPIPSKRRGSVHNKGRTRSIIGLVIQNDNNKSDNSVSPLSSPSPSIASSFSFISSTQNRSLSFFHSPSLPPNQTPQPSPSSSSKRTPPNFECANFMDVPKVQSKITGGQTLARQLTLVLTSPRLDQVKSPQARDEQRRR
jgi:hypothetical protein